MESRSRVSQLHHLPSQAIHAKAVDTSIFYSRRREAKTNYLSRQLMV
jgi:hypothetical protein